ncbi:haloacid dehalogenase type II [Microvirga rosea]|uniref:haloacid dehalogenase type II n=1 Tax=Microvirga rosea TaxID=2715425 RepID=UPI001D09F6E7|nr:haloacid dehalogenase type II [Microvirga rosea]MCB8820106.1 haloacid dehalogenase type II [Microvirga rosea]
MAPAPTVLATAKAVVFDAYGTLFDVHSVVARHAAAIGTSAQPFSDLWRQKQLEYSWVLSLAGRYEPFWILTERALDYAFTRFPEVDRGLRPALLQAYRKLDAYGDASSTLGALRRGGLRTGILSNGDPGMLDAAVTSADLGKDLDAVLSVDAAAVFKTHPRAYELALSAFSAGTDDIVFVSSNRWDIAGATAFGFRTVWINRAGLPEEYAELAPRAVVSSLRELLAD